MKRRGAAHPVCGAWSLWGLQQDWRLTVVDRVWQDGGFRCAVTQGKAPTLEVIRCRNAGVHGFLLSNGAWSVY
jgi:hypothetical protein